CASPRGIDKSKELSPLKISRAQNNWLAKKIRAWDAGRMPIVEVGFLESPHPFAVGKPVESTRPVVFENSTGQIGTSLGIYLSRAHARGKWICIGCVPICPLLFCNIVFLVIHHGRSVLQANAFEAAATLPMLMWSEAFAF